MRTLHNTYYVQIKQEVHSPTNSLPLKDPI